MTRRDWVQANDACRRDILARLRERGPLTSRELPDSCVVPWSSTGWTNNQNITKMLDFTVVRGEVATAGRRGRERLWDLATRVYPDVPPVPVEEAVCLRNDRRLRALGIARVKGPVSPSEPADVGDIGEPAVVGGVRGVWRIDSSLAVLRVHAVHEDEPFRPDVEAAVGAEIEALAAWWGLSTSGRSGGA